MAAIGTGGVFSNITIPITGMYAVSYRALYQSSTNTVATIAAYVTVNSRTSGASIARDLRKFNDNTGDQSPVHAYRILPLTAADILYWGNWSSATCSFRATQFGIPTEITAHYLGPV
jgi:hypothetical protein